MGSSNLNDRSQCGDRDSEIALLVEDKDMIPSQMNGQYVSVFGLYKPLSSHLICFEY